MRKRQMSYIHNDVTDKEKEHIFEFCRNANDEQKEIIKIALKEINPYLQPFIFMSLVENMSYEDICAKVEYMYISKVDFYGYRRYAVGCVKRWMILYNIWEFKE